MSWFSLVLLRGDKSGDSVDMNLSKLRKMVRNREALRVAVGGIAKSQTGLGDGTKTEVGKGR